MGPIRYLSSDIKSTPSLAPTLADATGQLAGSLETTPPVPKSPSRTLDKGKRRASDEAKPAKLSPRKATPSRNGGDGDGSLARSKSQLELVLEKDRARSGDKKGDARS